MQPNQVPLSAAPFSNARYLRQPEVLARVGVSWMTILRWERKGIFPARRRLGPNTVAWLESEIAEWCANCAKCSRSEDA